MPLLRQALYAQNINLYLAPTADGRDAWLSLMRTVGFEGRCFVVSSNMCVRDDGGNKSDASANGSAVIAEDDEVVGGDAQPYNAREGQSRVRRSSCVTEEGFEIALPSPRGGAKQPQAQLRRKSVRDEDGNEIVLHYDEAAAQGPALNGQGHATKKTSTGEKFISRGGSCITGPLGDVVAGPSWENETEIVYADVDFKDCIRGRLDLDAAGSYSR